MDAMGNNKTLDFEPNAPSDLLSVSLWQGSTYYYAELVYLGAGLFQATYLPMKSGQYTLSVKMGGFDIRCLAKVNNTPPTDSLAHTRRLTSPYVLNVCRVRRPRSARRSTPWWHRAPRCRR